MYVLNITCTVVHMPTVYYSRLFQIRNVYENLKFCWQDCDVTDVA
jgi:hypothetical protein